MRNEWDRKNTHKKHAWFGGMRDGQWVMTSHVIGGVRGDWGLEPHSWAVEWERWMTGGQNLHTWLVDSERWVGSELQTWLVDCERWVGSELQTRLVDPERWVWSEPTPDWWTVWGGWGQNPTPDWWTVNGARSEAHTWLVDCEWGGVRTPHLIGGLCEGRGHNPTPDWWTVNGVGSQPHAWLVDGWGCVRLCCNKLSARGKDSGVILLHVVASWVTERAMGRSNAPLACVVWRRGLGLSEILAEWWMVWQVMLCVYNPCLKL